MSHYGDPIPLVPGEDWGFRVATLNEDGSALDVSTWDVTSAKVEWSGGEIEVEVDLSDAGWAAVSASDADTATLPYGKVSKLTIWAQSPGGADKVIVFKEIDGRRIASPVDASSQIYGVPGRSAYEIALANGFVGTEAEWLDSFLNRANHTGTQEASTISDFAAAADARIGAALGIAGASPSIRDYTISVGNPLNDAKPYAWSPKLAADGDATTGGVGGFWNLMKEGVSQSIMTKAGRLALAGMLALGSGDASLASVGLKASGNAVQARLADDSGFADFAARGATLNPATNASGLTIASYSLSGANAQAALTIGGALDTSGSPNIFSIDIAHTASGAATKMIRAAYGGSEVFSVSKAGHVLAGLGSDTLPSLSFVGDPDTGLYSVGGANSIGIANGATVNVLFSSVGQTLRSSYEFGWSSGAPTSARDTILVRGGAGVLQLKNGTNAQTLQAYGTESGGGANYERFTIRFSGGDAVIGTENSGATSARGVNMITAGTARWYWSSSGHYYPSAGSSYDIGQSANSVRDIYTATVRVSSQIEVGTFGAYSALWGGHGRLASGSVVSWSSVSTNPSGANADLILARSAAGVLLLDNGSGSFDRIQVGGTTASFPAIKRNAAALDLRLADDSAYTDLTLRSLITTTGGDTTNLVVRYQPANNNGIYFPADGAIGFVLTSAERVRFSAGSGIIMRNDFGLKWVPSTTISATPDLVLVRDAANTLAMLNGTNAQTQRWYNTYTNASNYGRGFVSWASNVLRLGIERSGTGPSHTLALSRDGTDYLEMGGSTAAFWQITSGKAFLPGTGNSNLCDIGGTSSLVRNIFVGGYVKFTAQTVAGLPSAATAGVGATHLVDDANAPTWGATVAGGGSTVVRVMSDGTNWKVM